MDKYNMADEARENMKRVDKEYEARQKAAEIKFAIGMIILAIAILFIVWTFVTGGLIWM